MHKFKGGSQEEPAWLAKLKGVLRDTPLGQIPMREREFVGKLSSLFPVCITRITGKAMGTMSIEFLMAE